MRQAINAPNQGWQYGDLGGPRLYDIQGGYDLEQGFNYVPPPALNQLRGKRLISAVDRSARGFANAVPALLGYAYERVKRAKQEPLDDPMDVDKPYLPKRLRSIPKRRIRRKRTRYKIKKPKSSFGKHVVFKKAKVQTSRSF